MTENEKREAVARWMNYVVHTRPQYEIEMAASAIGTNGRHLRSIAQDIIKKGCGRDE